jgi:hypothetical protein
MPSSDRRAHYAECAVFGGVVLSFFLRYNMTWGRCSVSSTEWLLLVATMDIVGCPKWREGLRLGRSGRGGVLPIAQSLKLLPSELERANRER